MKNTREAELARKTLLLRLGDSIRHLSDPTAILRTAAEMLARELGMPQAIYGEVAENDGGYHTDVKAEWRESDRPSLIGRHDLRLFGSHYFERVISGRPWPVENVDTYPDEHVRIALQRYRAIGIRSALTYGVMRNNRLTALISLQGTVPRTWTQEQIDLVQEVGERTWAEVERARVEEQLRESETKLNLSLRASGMGVFYWYPQEDRTEADARVLELFALSATPELSLASALATMIHEDDRDHYAKSVAAAVDPEGTGRLEEEIRVRWQDASEHWLSVSAQVHFAGNPPRAKRMAGMIGEITERKQAEEKLQKLAASLDAEVRVRTAQLEARNTDLVVQSERLQQLSRRVMQMQDDERRHIARELHDSAGQTLTLLGLNLAKSAQLAKHSPNIVEAIKETQDLLQQLTQEIRTTSYLLHPPLLDEIGVAGTLTGYVEGLAQRSNLEIGLVIAPDLGRLPREVELAIFRSVQECLTNIHRHSGSRTAAIRVTRQNEEVLVEVTDHGTGISAEKLAEIHTGGSGVGLLGMRDRVKQLKGEFTIESSEAGTKISIHLPAPSLPDGTRVAAD